MAGVGALLMGAQNQPKAQKFCVMLTAGLLAWALIPLPNFVPAPIPSLVVPGTSEMIVRIMAACVAVFLAWRQFPMQAPRASVQCIAIHGKAILRVTNTGPTAGDFHAIGVIPARKTAPFSLSWRGTECKVNIGPRQYIDIHLAELADDGSLNFLTCDNAGGKVRIRIASPGGRLADDAISPRLEESPGYVIVTIYSDPMPYLSVGWAWKGRLNVLWDGANELDLKCLEELPSPIWQKVVPNAAPPQDNLANEDLILMASRQVSTDAGSFNDIISYPSSFSQVISSSLRGAPEFPDISVAGQAEPDLDAMLTVRNDGPSDTFRAHIRVVKAIHCGVIGSEMYQAEWEARDEAALVPYSRPLGGAYSRATTGVINLPRHGRGQLLLAHAIVNGGVMEISLPSFDGQSEHYSWDMDGEEPRITLEIEVSSDRETRRPKTILAAVSIHRWIGREAREPSPKGFLSVEVI